ncbi:hypothetical protein VTN00DRAFT_6757 [Thermoascus crustaceus]|uniref:uncharacterized protein n=1 Tax=Thermoascus crustaceus TaxID=5088 RepID=UPI0037435D65
MSIKWMLKKDPSLASRLEGLKYVRRHEDETRDVTIENCIGFSQVPLGLAGPLKVEGPENTNDVFYAPLATYEPTLVASCSRGCKAFNLSGGIQFEVLEDAMCRAPVFHFADTGKAVAFARRVPELQAQFAKDAESTSRHARLLKLTPHIIGPRVHVRFDYSCADATGQNMTTIATQKACDEFMNSHLAKELQVQGFLVEGQMAADKKSSWGNVIQSPGRGVRVIAWGKITDEACREVLKCSTEELHHSLAIVKDAETRNGQFGSNINVVNVVTAMLIACGQDPACVAEALWSHVTAEYDRETKDLNWTIFIPSLPVGVVGAGTFYGTQKECLELLQCRGPGMKRRLAGLIAAFALALDVSTLSAVTSHGFTSAHERLRRGSRL